MSIRFKLILCTFLVFALFRNLNLHAQHQETNEKPSIWRGKHKQTQDSTSLLSAFKSGQTHGHFRYMFMATENQPGLRDYYGNALGGGLRFETGNFYGFQLGISGFFIFNVGSSDFTQNDPVTGKGSRYELALFDLTDSHNKHDIDRLEELFVKYSFGKHSHIEFGKILLNTPLINLQDGRMRPSGVEGLWFDINELKHWEFQGGYLYGFSPRSTVEWYQGGKSIGLYENGISSNGQAANYRGNVESIGTFVLSAKNKISNKVSIQAWNYLIENTLNTGLIQLDTRFPVDSNQNYFASAQFIRQDGINHGGNPDPSKTYVEKGHTSMTWGGRVGWKNKNWTIDLNYNRITHHGRFVFPREWGRLAFFSFIPRERNEGLGNVNAMSTRIAYRIPKTGFEILLSGGYYDLPDVKNYRLNKYGLPSYSHVNLDLRYHFNGFLEGLDAQLLITRKNNHGEIYGDLNYIFNKVNVTLYTFMLNYHF